MEIEERVKLIEEGTLMMKELIISGAGLKFPNKTYI